MRDPAEIAGLIGDGPSLGAYVVSALQRRIDAGEVLEWIREQQTDPGRLAGVGVAVHSFVLPSGDALIRVWCLDGSKVTDPTLKQRVAGMERFSVEITRDGEVLGRVSTTHASTPLGRFVIDVVNSADIRRREMRREFLNGFGE